jgi:hypothetical protein
MADDGAPCVGSNSVPGHSEFAQEVQTALSRPATERAARRWAGVAVREARFNRSVKRPRHNREDNDRAAADPTGLVSRGPSGGEVRKSVEPDGNIFITRLALDQSTWAL